MKQLTFIYQLLKFILISVPLGLCIFLTAHLYFEIKRLCLKYSHAQDVDAAAKK